MVILDFLKSLLTSQMTIGQYEAQRSADTKEKREAIESSKNNKNAKPNTKSNKKAKIKPPHRASVSSSSSTASQVSSPASKSSSQTSQSSESQDSSPEVSIRRDSKEDSDTIEARMERLVAAALEKQRIELAAQQVAQQKDVQDKLDNLKAENERLKAEQTKWREEQEKEKATQQAARASQEAREALEAQKSQETIRRQKELEEKLLKMQRDAELLKMEKEEEIKKQRELEEKIILEKKKIQEEAEEKLKQERAAHEAKIKADIEARAKLLKEMAEAEIAKLQKEKEQDKQQEDREQSKGAKASASASSINPKILAERKKKQSQRELIIQALEEIIKKQNRIIQGAIKYTGDIMAYAKQASFNDLEELYKKLEKSNDPILSPLLWAVPEMPDPYKLELRALAEKAKISLDKLQSVEMTVQIHDFEENCGLEKRMTYVLNGYGLQASSGSDSGNAAQSSADFKQRKEQGRELAIGMSKNGKPIVVHFTMNEHGIQINDAHEGNGDEYANAVKNHRGVFLMAKNKNISRWTTL